MPTNRIPNLLRSLKRALTPRGPIGIRHAHYWRLNNRQYALQLGPIHVSVDKGSRGRRFQMGRDKWITRSLLELAWSCPTEHKWWARHISVTWGQHLNARQWAEHRSIGRRVEWALPGEMPHVKAARAAACEMDAEEYEMACIEHYGEPVAW